MEKEISFTSDIIKEVSQKLDIPEGKVRGVYRVMTNYLIYLANKTSAISIFIPSIGVLYLKVGSLYKKLKYYKRNKDQKNLDIYLKKKEKMDSFITKSKMKDFSKRTRHELIPNHLNYAYNIGKSMLEIEEVQEKIYNGEKK